MISISYSDIIRKIILTVGPWIKFPIRLVKLKKVIQLPTYYPELERKSYREMWVDNLIWLIKNKEINYLYTGYGLDIKNFRNPDDFIAHREFNLQRDSGVKTKQSFYGKPYNEVVLVRDKYVFAAYLAATLGDEILPKTIALIDNNEVFLYSLKKWVSFSEFCKKDFEYVFKEIDGTYGNGVRLVKNAKGILYSDGQEYTFTQFVTKCKGRILIQERITQHPVLKAFKTECVNTIRIITVRGQSGIIGVFAAFLRLGNDNNSFVDNRAKGGLAVGVDLKTGCLLKYGFPHERFGIKTDIHPLSGIVFEGYQLPYWKETMEMVLTAHKQFPDIISLGWDVTMTNDRPIIIEANDGWEISGPQDTYGGLKERWKKMHEQ